MELFNRIFNRWTKWEIYESDKPYILDRRNPITGFGYTTNVIVDIYVKENRYTGLKKYKKVIKK